MECTSHLQRQCSLSSSFLQFFAGGVDGLHATRDDELSWAVVVGGNDDRCCLAHFSADGFNLVVCKSHDGSHGGRRFLASLLHGHGASIYEFQSVFEAECSGSHECRELTEGVACNHRRLEVVAEADGLDDAVEEDCRLCHLSLLEFVVGSFEHDVGYPVAKYFVGFFEKLLGFRIVVVQVFAHTCELCSLSWENKCFHFFLLFMNL